jgi:hypothetical protein
MTVQTLNNDEDNRGENIKNEAQNELRSLWLGRRDSNPRMSAPKADALPLGHAPIKLLETSNYRGNCTLTRVKCQVLFG